MLFLSSFLLVPPNATPLVEMYPYIKHNPNLGKVIINRNDAGPLEARSYNVANNKKVANILVANDHFPQDSGNFYVQVYHKLYEIPLEQYSK